MYKYSAGGNLFCLVILKNHMVTESLDKTNKQQIAAKENILLKIGEL